MTNRRATRPHEWGATLSDVGRRQEALRVAREAVALYRQLAQRNPDAFRPDLVSSLNNLANRLNEVGLRDEALEATREATELQRLLAQVKTTT